MAFDKLEAIVLDSRQATVKLAPSKRSPWPRCVVDLTGEFCAAHGVQPGERFDVLLGTGAEKGLMRLKRNEKNGVAVATRCGGRKSAAGNGAVRFHLGFIERFGTEPEPKQPCRAYMVDADTIEIVLPKWAEEQDV